MRSVNAMTQSALTRLCYKFQIDASFVAAFLLALGGIFSVSRASILRRSESQLGSSEAMDFASGRRVRKNGAIPVETVFTS
jgi:hypothetical protein